MTIRNEAHVSKLQALSWGAAAVAATATTANAEFVQINLTGNQITAGGGNQLVADLDGDGTNDVAFTQVLATSFWSNGTFLSYMMNGALIKIDGVPFSARTLGYTSVGTFSYTTTQGPAAGPSGFLSIALSGKPGKNAWLEVERRLDGRGIGGTVGDPGAGIYLPRVVYDHDNGVGTPDINKAYSTNETSDVLYVTPIVDVFCHNEKDNFTGFPTDMITGSGMNGNPEDYSGPWPTNLPSLWTPTENGYGFEWQSRDLLDDELPVNGKIGWTIFDMGNVVSNLAGFNIWNERENTNRFTKTFNVYVASAPTNAPVHGPTDETSTDYDFAGGGWAQINTNGTLNGTFRSSQIVDLGRTNARYVAVEILSNNGDPDRVGMAEVGVTYYAPEIRSYDLSIDNLWSTPTNTWLVFTSTHDSEVDAKAWYTTNMVSTNWLPVQNPGHTFTPGSGTYSQWFDTVVSSAPVYFRVTSTNEP